MGEGGSCSLADIELCNSTSTHQMALYFVFWPVQKSTIAKNES